MEHKSPVSWAKIENRNCSGHGIGTFHGLRGLPKCVCHLGFVGDKCQFETGFLPFEKPPSPFYANGGQDYLLAEGVFGYARKGFFVEIGANCFSGSNCHFFEKTLNWRGLCVQPMPIWQGQLQNHRPSCILEPVCLWSETKEMKLVNTDLTGRSFLVDAGAMHYGDKRLEDIVAKEVTQGQEPFISVQCKKLEDLLEKHGITEIDYLSIDAEGAELAILSTINWKKRSITAISTETGRNDEEIFKLLHENGFVHLGKCGKKWDNLFVNPAARFKRHRQLL